MSHHFSAGALCATAIDLVRWSHRLFAGNVVPDSMLRQMITPPEVRSGSTSYGFGVGVGEAAGVRRVSHTGLVAGFASVLQYFPEHDLGVAVLFNTDGSPPNRLATLLAGTALGIELPVVQDLPTPPALQAVYVGEYDLGPLQLRVFDPDGQIWAQATGQPPNRLLYQGGQEFRLAFDPSVRFVFEVEGGSATGFVLHQGGATISARRVE